MTLPYGKLRGVIVLLALAAASLAGASASAADSPKAPTTQEMITRATGQRDQKQFDNAIKSCEAVIALPGATAAQKQEAFEVLTGVYQRKPDLEKALATAARMGGELPASRAAQARSSVLQGSLCVDMNRGAEALAHFSNGIQRSDDPRVRQVCLYRIATLHLAASRHAEALETFERLFIDNPGVADYWYDAQRNSVELLRKLNRPEEALRAARICLDAGGDAGAIAGNTQLIAGLLQEIDKNVTRANAMIAFQQYGPAGKDGQSGTADDLANPLAGVPYPAYPKRDEVFAKLRPIAGDNANASRVRALTYIYTGHPAEALPHFAEAFRRGHGSAWEIQSAVNDLIAVGVRSVQGHPAALQRFYAFVHSGPPGPDGESGTADDLKDPFAEIGLPPRIPSDDGGLVPPAAADRAALVELRGVLKKMIVGERDDLAFRNECVVSLQRVHGTLCDWGTKGQADWYFRLLMDCPAAQSNIYSQSSLAAAGEAAARGSDLHFAGQRAFWQDVEFEVVTNGYALGDPARGVRRNHDQTLKLLEKPPSLVPKLPPMK